MGDVEFEDVPGQHVGAKQDPLFEAENHVLHQVVVGIGMAQSDDGAFERLEPDQFGVLLAEQIRGSQGRLGGADGVGAILSSI